MSVNIVATTPRSRSSLVMRILLALAPGRVAGYQFPAEQRFAEAGLPVSEDEKTRIERTRRLNPEGFYELPGVFAHGLPHTAPAMNPQDSTGEPSENGDK